MDVISLRPAALALHRPAKTLSRGIAQWSLMLLFLVSNVSEARAWKGINPGVTTRAELIDKFGEPMKVLKSADREVLAYFGRKTIPGTVQVLFRIDPVKSNVTRIDVFPANKPGTTIDYQSVEASFGKACTPSTPKGTACYVRKVTDDLRTYLEYASLGLTVVFERSGKLASHVIFFPTPSATEKQPEVSAENQAAHGTETESSKAVEESHPEVATEGREGFGFESLSGGEGGLLKDSLQIGGQFYLRAQSFGLLGYLNNACCGTPDTFQPQFDAPMLLDVYFDARPNDWVRGMALARVSFDPFSAANGSSANEASVALDQLWFSFAFYKTVFVTAGRQHVHWGVSHFWSPTDFLASAARDPVALFDQRVGTDLLKIQVPWPDAGMNFYAIGIVTPSLSPLRAVDTGVGVRVELARQRGEVGLDAVFTQAGRPRYGMDFSVGIGYVDIYGELALRTDSDYPIYRYRNPLPSGTSYQASIETYQPTGRFLAGSGGLSLPIGFTDKITLTLGAEGYYNQLGYTQDTLLPWMMAQNTYRRFYFGQLYAAAYASLALDDDFNAKTIRLAGLSDLTDGSAVTRFDFSVRLASHATWYLFAEAPFGAAGGEFRPQANIAADTSGPTPLPAVQLPLPLFDVGIGLIIKV